MLWAWLLVTLSMGEWACGECLGRLESSLLNSLDLNSPERIGLKDTRIRRRGFLKAVGSAAVGASLLVTRNASAREKKDHFLDSHASRLNLLLYLQVSLFIFFYFFRFFFDKLNYFGYYFIIRNFFCLHSLYI